MNLRLQLVVAAVIILAMIYITNKIRKRQVELKYALIWYALGIVYLLFDLIPYFPADDNSIKADKNDNEACAGNRYTKRRDKRTREKTLIR